MIELKAVQDRMEQIRRRAGFTQLQLAQILGVSQSAMSKYMKDRLPPAEVLLKLAKLGNTTVEWLLTGEKNYWFTKSHPYVEEEVLKYDVDLSLARKISRLPRDIRQAVVTLIDHFSAEHDE